MLEDGVYITYTLPGGADTVQKKLGSGAGYLAVCGIISTGNPALYDRERTMMYDADTFEVASEDTCKYTVKKSGTLSTMIHLQFGAAASAYITVYKNGTALSGRGGGSVGIVYKNETSVAEGDVITFSTGGASRASVVLIITDDPLS